MLLPVLIALQTSVPPPVAAIPASPAQVASAAPAPKSDRMICRADTHTGSHVSSRTCRTERQWREAEDSSAEWLRTNRPISCTAGLGVCAGGR